LRARKHECRRAATPGGMTHATSWGSQLLEESVMGTIESSVDNSMAKLEDQLKLWGAKLDELVAKMEVAGQETKIDARKHLDEVKARLVTARSKLDEAKAAGRDKWDGFKSGVESSWKELEAAFQKLTH
jgi:hypothetical protein